MSALLWLRRDLRLHDNPALHAALASAQQGIVVPVFCLDPRLLHGRHASGPRTQFLLESLRELDRGLRARGSALVIRHGRPEKELPRLARDVGARSVHLTGDVSGFARRRDERTIRALRAVGIAASAHPGIFVLDDVAALLTQAGDPFSVFSPFHRAWLKAPRRRALPAPDRLPPLPRQLERGQIPRLEDLGLAQEVSDPARGGESAGRAAMAAFLHDGVLAYNRGRDGLVEGQPSRLSPYLHMGCISARELESRLPAGEAACAFRRELCWRDFYGHVLAHNPANAHSEYQARFRGTIRWSHDERRFGAWCEGRTGFPLVDAGMRQLRAEGWMHNRARLVVGSFLTKHLGIDWRWGERWFMRLLVDGDEASNNGNWQWIASVGVDPQPPYRRLYNPARQQSTFDPRGAYVRRYVPELRAVPDEHLAEPWRMPPLLQEEVGCVIGRDYPEPIVDHLVARRAALERYAAARSVPARR